MKRGTAGVVALTAALVLTGTDVSADPVRIVTSGLVFQIPEDGETGARFVGAGFDLSGLEVTQTTGAVCNPCTPGSTLDLSSTMVLNAFPSGQAIVDGHLHDTVFFSGLLDFDAGSVVVPDVPLGGPYPRPETGFTFTGTVSGFADDSRTGSPLFSLQLVGSGTASIGFFNYPVDPGIRVDGFSYSFQEQAPVPEPASLLLLGSGLAGLMARRRMGSRAKHA